LISSCLVGVGGVAERHTDFLWQRLRTKIPARHTRQIDSGTHQCRVVATYFLCKGHLRATKLRDSDTDINQVVESGRANKLHFNAANDEQHAKSFLELMQFKSEMPEPFRACPLQEIQLSAVIYDFAGIGVLKIHPDGD
jgi:hypothetical protein